MPLFRTEPNMGTRALTTKAPAPLVVAHLETKAVRARKFVLSLLEFEGVEGAIVEAGGWGNVEMWASSLKK